MHLPNYTLKLNTVYHCNNDLNLLTKTLHIKPLFSQHPAFANIYTISKYTDIINELWNENKVYDGAFKRQHRDQIPYRTHFQISVMTVQHYHKRKPTISANHIHSMEIKSYGNRNPNNCNCCANHIIPIEIEIQSIVTIVQTTR